MIEMIIANNGIAMMNKTYGEYMDGVTKIIDRRLIDVAELYTDRASPFRDAEEETYELFV